MQTDQKEKEEKKAAYFVACNMADTVTLYSLRDWYTKTLRGDHGDEDNEPDRYVNFRVKNVETIKKLEEQEESENSDQEEAEMKRDRCKFGHQLKFINK